jgi:hypothetical protein
MSTITIGTRDRGGVLILPDLTGVTYPHVLVQAGKTGTIYLVNRDGMGKWCNTIDGGSDTCTDQDVQEILGSACGSDGHPPCGSSANLAGIWGSPAYWNGNVYFPSAQKESDLGGSVADYMKTYSFNAGGSGVLSSQPTSHTPEKFNWPGPNPTVSSNGTSNGIVWTVDVSSYASSCCEVLYAYDATNLNNELFNTNQSGCGPVNNNQLGGAIKFSVPTAANGKVYVADASELNVFGLYSLSTTASVSPTSLTLLSQYNNPAYGTARVTNDGPGELCFSSISVSGDYMSLYSTTCGALSPGSSCVATVEYNPGGCYAIVNGELDFYDDTSSGGQSVSLTGKTAKCTTKPSP